MHFSARAAHVQRTIALIGALAHAALGQVTYYVRNGGDDTQDGRSDRTAFATLGRIHRLALFPGDSVLLRRGSRWTETLAAANRSGAKGRPIVYGAYGTGGLPVIDGGRSVGYGIDVSWVGLSYLRFENMEITGTVDAGVLYNESGSLGLVFDHLLLHHNLSHAITLRRTDSCVVQYCTLLSNGYTPAPGNPTAHGIYVSLCHGALVQHNTIDSAQGAGVHAFECLGTTIRYNTIRRCGLTETGAGDGILLWTDQPAPVDCYYNYLYDNFGRGITVRNCAAGSTINVENNTVAATRGTGLFIYENPAGVIANARNNILAFSGGYDLEVSSPSATVSLDYNLYYRESGTTAAVNGTYFAVLDSSGLKDGVLGAHSIQQDPLFVDIGRSPAIMASSPCRDAGVDLGLTHDIEGVTMDPTNTGRVDIGSYEVVRSSPPPVTPPGTPASSGYALLQNYPNPFNPSTQIRFQVKEEAHVTVAVYDLLGREVATAADGVFAAGNHTVLFSGAGIASGIYLVRMQAGGFSAARTILLMR